MTAQHEAKPGPPIRAVFARIGVASGVLGKVGKFSRAAEGRHGSHQTLRGQEQRSSWPHFNPNEKLSPELVP